MKNELKQLIKLEGEKMSITSIDLCKLINILRREEKGKEAKELRHDNLMRSIKSEIEILNNLGFNDLNFKVVNYIDSKGEARPCYTMNDKGMLQILNKESTFVRYKTSKLIEELKEENAKLKQQLTQEQQLALKVYEGGMDALTAHKKLLALKTKELSDKIVEQKEEIEKKDIEIETHLETIGEQKEEIETQNEEIKQLSPLAETLIKRFEKGENIGWADVTKTFKLKRGQASKWAINNGYIYKNKKDVTNKGDIYFQRYVINGFKNICITPQGVQLIEQHLEEIKAL